MPVFDRAFFWKAGGHPRLRGDMPFWKALLATSTNPSRPFIGKPTKSLLGVLAGASLAKTGKATFASDV